MSPRAKVYLIEGAALAVVLCLTAALALTVVFVIEGNDLELGTVRNLGLASLAWCIVGGISFVKISKYANNTLTRALPGERRPVGDNNQLNN